MKLFYMSRRIAVFAWMFLSISGATVINRVLTRDGRIARRRGKSKAMMGIHSVNQVRLNVPAGVVFRNPTSFKRGPGVRYHDVRGHWREIEVEGARVLRWIQPFWRGDPRLGVIIKRREVVAPAAAAMVH